MGSRIALGLIETRGFASLTHATDAMNEAAAAETLDCVQIGMD